MRSATRAARAYRRELEILMIRRQFAGFWVGCGFVGLFAILESRFFPERIPYLAAWLLGAASPMLLVLWLRRVLLRRFMVSWATAVALGVTLLTLVGYAATVGADSAVTGAQVMVGLLVAAVVFPWPAACQLAAGLPPLVAYGWLAWIQPSVAPAPYILAVVGTAVAASVLVARHLDLQRWAIFRESRARDEAMVVTRSLLKMARELGSAVDPRVVLDRIVHRARALLHADWCVILLRAPDTTTFRIAAGSALRLDLLEEATGLEFRIEDYPTLHGLSDPATLVEVSRRNPPDARWRALMRYFRTRAMVVAPMDLSDRVIGLLAVGRGATDEGFPPRDHRILQGIARQAAIALENARLFSDLEKANRLKSEFVATMSHELRTPLNIVIGYADLLAEHAFGPVPEAAAEPLERIREQGRELLQLIDATLDVNRLESGNVALDITEERLSKFMAGLTEQLLRLPRAAAVEFKAMVLADGWVRTDVNKVAIILKNLVGNALKFTSEGEVRLEAAVLNSGTVRFVVEDTGPGIPEAEQERVFDMFYQVQRPGELPRGVGLGLYIVRQFVSLVGGTVALRSEERKGTTFVVEIPAARRVTEASTHPESTRPELVRHD
ncbi:MAG: GAF domain-containing sensor histidine kinase [Candidatus Binatia bacterium]|nr:GAF domain-containing sensor histidine kinase [Candidatus Binatia bacterium]